LKSDATVVKASSRVERVRIGFEADGAPGISRKLVGPIAVAAADVEQTVLLCGRDSTKELFEFSPPVQRTHALYGTDKPHEGHV
jgi:hypothetical protein